MKNITSMVSGLASSLLLNAGFESFAQKLDPVSSLPVNAARDNHGPGYCMPCQFTPKRSA